MSSKKLVSALLAALSSVSLSGGNLSFAAPKKLKQGNNTMKRSKSLKLGKREKINLVKGSNEIKNMEKDLNKNARKGVSYKVIGYTAGGVVVAVFLTGLGIVGFKKFKRQDVKKNSEDVLILIDKKVIDKNGNAGGELINEPLLENEKPEDQNKDKDKIENSGSEDDENEDFDFGGKVNENNVKQEEVKDDEFIIKKELIVKDKNFGPKVENGGEGGEAGKNVIGFKKSVKDLSDDDREAYFGFDKPEVKVNNKGFIGRDDLLKLILWNYADVDVNGFGTEEFLEFCVDGSLDENLKLALRGAIQNFLYTLHSKSKQLGTKIVFKFDKDFGNKLNEDNAWKLEINSFKNLVKFGGFTLRYEASKFEQFVTLPGSLFGFGKEMLVNVRDLCV